MHLKKEGMPEEDEIVLCTVTNVHHHSVFVKVEEYNMQGMIHISEVSPGRIRNIRDYVKEGKVIVCKVLRINRERRQIDLSLRRVNEAQRRNKIDGIKKEQKAEKIIEFVANKVKEEPKKVFEEVSSKILKKYSSVYAAFEDVITNDKLLKELGLEAKIAKELTEAIKLRIKAPEVVIGGKFTLLSYKSNGVEIIKNAFKETGKTKDVTIRYDGGGKYNITVKAKDYKTAEKVLDDSTRSVIDSMKKNESVAEFVREER